MNIMNLVHEEVSYENNQYLTNNKCKEYQMELDSFEGTECYLRSKQKRIHEERPKSNDELQIQAKRLKHISELSHHEVGMSVRVNMLTEVGEMLEQF